MKCPKCKSKEVIPIIYGDVAMPKGEKDGDKYFLGGCIFDENSPQWYCKKCKHRW
ncbi:MAG: hypothetical protein ABIJ92_01540 [Candidatus Aenigmatarchaeota archaeon]